MQAIQSTLDPRLRAALGETHPLPGVRAGSALVRWGDRLLAVQDDAYEFAYITPRNGKTPSIQSIACGERLGPLPKPEKPDFEAAFVHQGAIYVIGSGSGPQRRHFIRLVPDPHCLSFRDAGPLLDAVSAALGGVPNIEGALVEGDALTLFHRGTTKSPNVAITLNASALDRAPPVVTDVVELDLGAIAGVPFTVTDVAPIPGGYVYLACAEATANAIDDGPVIGAALGVVREGAGRFALIDGARKYEGIALDPDLRGAYVITDPDDAERSAELCRVQLHRAVVDASGGAR